ncbi:hypothetical protein EJB05_40375, partial [Eragrostis curvula]
MSADEGASASVPPPPEAPPAGGAMGAEEAAARKRYEALLQVRAKAVKGKGAWYWAHLEPVLAPLPGSGAPPKTARLRCVLCAATFSASNPSRTASEHLKRGACPNFAAPLAVVPGASPPQPQALTVAAASSIVPISSFPPSTQRRHSTGGGGGRKRHALAAAYAAVEAAASQQHVVMGGEPAAYSSTPPTPPALPAPRQALSGGRGDLSALARFEDSVKRLKSPVASPGAMLPRQQAEAALSLLADWFLESSGSVSLAAAEHPKLGAFLRQVGLPELPSRAELARARLATRYAEARADVAARVRDARFFQLAADGWREPVVSLAVNLPNGTSVFHRAVPMAAPPSSDYAEEVMMDAVSSISAASDIQHCAGVVADRFGSKALRDLESKHPWMVNLPCQAHDLTRLARDLARELPLFHSAAANCVKIATYFNATPTARALLHKHQVQEHGHAMLLCVAAPPSNDTTNEFTASFAMLEDVLTSARPLQLAVLEEPYKLVCIDDSAAREIAGMVQNRAFWTEVEAAHSLVKLITDTVKEMETERPLVGQCIPLWEDLRGKVRGWCRKFNADEGVAMNVVENRFRKSYHPAWSAAFILDPLYLIKDPSGRYLPPFNYLSPEQERDVDMLIRRLVSPEEAHLAMMELMKWRSEGLDPLYAQAVQVRQPDPATGKMKIANKQSSRLVWETCLKELTSLGKVAVRLIFLHATAKSFRCTPTMARWLTASSARAAGSISRSQRLVFVAANSKLERKDFSNDDDRDMELLTEGDDDMLTDQTPDPSSV